MSRDPETYLEMFNKVTTRQFQEWERLLIIRDSFEAAWDMSDPQPSREPDAVATERYGAVVLRMDVMESKIQNSLVMFSQAHLKLIEADIKRGTVVPMIDIMQLITSLSAAYGRYLDVNPVRREKLQNELEAVRNDFYGKNPGVLKTMREAGALAGARR